VHTIAEPPARTNGSHRAPGVVTWDGRYPTRRIRYAVPHFRCGSAKPHYPAASPSRGQAQREVGRVVVPKAVDDDTVAITKRRVCRDERQRVAVQTRCGPYAGRRGSPECAGDPSPALCCATVRCWRIRLGRALRPRFAMLC